MTGKRTVAKVRLWRATGQGQVPGLLLLLGNSHLEDICRTDTAVPRSLECYEGSGGPEDSRSCLPT